MARRANVVVGAAHAHVVAAAALGREHGLRKGRQRRAGAGPGVCRRGRSVVRMRGPRLRRRRHGGPSAPRWRGGAPARAVVRSRRAAAGGRAPAAAGPELGGDPPSVPGLGDPAAGAAGVSPASRVRKSPPAAPAAASRGGRGRGRTRRAEVESAAAAPPPRPDPAPPRPRPRPRAAAPPPQRPNNPELGCERAVERGTAGPARPREGHRQCTTGDVWPSEPGRPKHAVHALCSEVIKLVQ